MVYINLICPESMVEDHKKSENELKVNVLIHHERIKELEKRVLALEKALMHVQHTNTDDGSRHRNDGGWFD